MLWGKQGNESAFELYDKDSLLGTTAKIGTVRLSSRRLAKILTQRSEERIEFVVENGIVLTDSEEEEDRDDTKQAGESALQRTKLALRFRIATKPDEEWWP